MLLKEFIPQGEFRKGILSVVLAGCFAVDLYYLVQYILRVRRLLNQKPVQCRLEDIFLVRYKDDGKIRYVPYLIVRSNEDQKLYITYDKYSLMRLKAKVENFGGTDISCVVYRNDNVPVRIGDRVDMYMQKQVNIPVSIDPYGNIVRLKRRKIPFYHMNERISITAFEEAIFFKGILDVDTDYR